MSEFSKVLKTKSGSLEDNFGCLLPKQDSFPADSLTGIYFFDRRCRVRIANQPELRQKAYELLHKLYSKTGIAPNEPSGLWLSIYDSLPETTTFVAEDDQGEFAGALTVVFDSPIGLPADALYKEEIDRMRSSGRKVCEIISLGINDTAKGSVKLLAGLFYCAYLLSWRSKNSTDFVITVHARYEKFYCRNILFKKIGAVRNYAKVNGAPTVLLNLPLMLPDMLKEKRRIFPLSMLNYSDQKELEVTQKIEAMLTPFSEEEFYYFFIDKTDIWEEATPQQKDYIKKIYPPHQTDHFKVSRALAKGFSKKIRNTHNNNEK
jgi:hypothetical protein